MISQESFNKLSQLDRIEYRQRTDKLEIEIFPLTRYILWTLVGIIAFLILFIPQAITAFGEDKVNGMLDRLQLTMAPLIFISIILAVIADLLIAFLINRKRSLIDEEYLKKVGSDKK